MKTFVKFTENKDTAQFLNQIISEYPDTHSMQVYADYLEEKGDPLAQIWRNIAEGKKIFFVRESIAYLSGMHSTNLHWRTSPYKNLEQLITYLFFQNKLAPEAKKEITIKINNQLLPPEINEMIIGVFNNIKLKN